MKFCAASALLATLAASTAFAAPAAPVAPPPVVQGPPIPGLCVLSVNQAISTSTVGRYVSERMSQIVSQVKAELGPEDTAISTEGRALEAARPTLAAATFQSRAEALQGRVNALRQKADLRQREVQATEQKSINRIAQELDPVARQLYQAKRCSILVNKDSVMIANPEMDLTSQAVAALNGRIQQFAFDREHLDTQTAAAR
ncbi:MAG TPA: OmpH family outer membrane protein [Caulobacteraceae bacterium]|jgi:outer membrane protein|nr:OmpH family outer membrane protein [Caulobacteraceae bacterium]